MRSYSTSIKYTYCACVDVWRGRKPKPKSVDGAWQKCKDDNRDKYAISINDIVMAKMKGHLPWAANVREIENKNRVKVEFFGTQEYERYGFINITEIIPFVNSFDVIRLILERNNIKFNKAVQEAEIACDLPSHMCFNHT